MDENTELYKELQPGTALNGGKYIIEKKIGEGGFGITYKAMQTGLNRSVCIKEYFLAGRCVRNTYARTVQLQGVGEDVFEKYRQAFVKEAQTLASLRHPNIVEVIDIFDENNTSYMVMPFIEGRSLQSIVEKNGPLPYPEAVNYIAQITNAVGYIHERHILHRDIKPENIMITADYKAILIDFGSAREFEQDKTQRHTSMLTHGYAPPEQYTANSRKGSYTDIYALGASLYFILTGQVPIEAAARSIEELPEPKSLNSKIPDEANRTIMKAMQLKVTDRYQTVQEFMDDLKNVHQDVPQKDEKSRKEKKEKKEKNSKQRTIIKRWLLLGVLAVVIVTAGIIATNMIVQHVKEKERIAKEIEEQQKHEKLLQELRFTYEGAIRDFDSNNNNIVVDPDGREGCQDWIKDALKSLQVIEQCEQDSLYPQLEVSPCFEDKYYLFQAKLVEARMNIYEKNKRDLEQDVHNPYYDTIRERLEYIDYILAQTHGKSVLNIQTDFTNAQNNTPAR